MTRRHLIIIFVLSILSITLLVALFFRANTADGTLVVLSAPDSLRMNCDKISKNITSKQPISIQSGQYTCTFSADGFESHTTSFTITKGNEGRLVFMLKPQTDNARNELAKPKYDEIRDGVGSHKVVEGGKKIEDINPIIKQLPYYSRWFSIVPCGAHRGGKTKIGICVTTTDKTSEEQVATALKRLEQIDKNYREYDLSINGILIPNKAELDARVAIPCGEGHPSWCYRFIRH